MLFNTQRQFVVREFSMGASTAVVSRANILQRFNAFRERHGVTNAFCKSLDLVLQKVFRTSVHNVVWLEHNAVEHVAAVDPRFTFRFLTADEIEKYAQDPSYYLAPTLADAVRNGRELCFAALS